MTSKKNAVLSAVVLAIVGSAGAADIDAGKSTFEHRCASCHAIGPSARGGFAPQLTGIVGRRAAATADFKYSQAMKASGIVWTEKNLARFINAPGDVVPGTSMRFWGMGNEQQVANLVAYLRTFK
ncbi:MAG: cytochrome c family protein [Massilia sp.]|jgi:cytochrome c|nr:cytochrome c family protein [Massilia sp.]MDB5952854.1 cytochrome c family protein [Massilia sp.]